jgi:hypothetical protein
MVMPAALARRRTIFQDHATVGFDELGEAFA